MASAKIISLCLVTLSLVVLVAAHSSSYPSSSEYGLSSYDSLYSGHHHCRMEYVSDYELLRELELRRQTYSVSSTFSGGQGGFRPSSSSSSSLSQLDQLSLEELLIASGKLNNPRGFRGGHGPVVTHRGPQGSAGAGSIGSIGAAGAIGSIKNDREHASFHHSGPSASHTVGAFKENSGHNRENIRTDSKGFGHESHKDINIDQGFNDREGFIDQDKVSAGSSSAEFDRQSSKATGAIGHAGAKGASGLGATGDLGSSRTSL